MARKQETTAFLLELEKHSGRKLNFPEELGQLLDLADRSGKSQAFEDAIFHAKFLRRSQEVMQRIGEKGEGFDKLSAEYQSSLEKTTSLLKTIAKELPEDSKSYFAKTFFTTNQESFSKLQGLLDDLNRMKNWQLDGKPLPWSGTSLNQVVRNTKQVKLSTLSSTVRLLVLLFIAFLLFDPPVSILGWVFSFLILALLIYVALILSDLRRNESSTQLMP